MTNYDASWIRLTWDVPLDKNDYGEDIVYQELTYAIRIDKQGPFVSIEKVDIYKSEIGDATFIEFNQTPEFDYSEGVPDPDAVRPVNKGDVFTVYCYAINSI